MKREPLFVCKRDHALFVDIETVIPEEDFDLFLDQDTTSPDRSIGYDPDRLSGRISFKKIHGYSLYEGFVGLNPHNAANSTFRISYYVALN